MENTVQSDVSPLLTWNIDVKVESGSEAGEGAGQVTNPAREAASATSMASQPLHPPQPPVFQGGQDFQEPTSFNTPGSGGNSQSTGYRLASLQDESPVHRFRNVQLQPPHSSHLSPSLSLGASLAQSASKPSSFLDDDDFGDFASPSITTNGASTFPIDQPIQALSSSKSFSIDEPMMPASRPLPKYPVPLIINDSGRTVDSSGNEIQLNAHIPILKANLKNVMKKEEFKPVKPEPEIDGMLSQTCFSRLASLQDESPVHRFRNVQLQPPHSLHLPPSLSLGAPLAQSASKPSSFLDDDDFGDFASPSNTTTGASTFPIDQPMQALSSSKSFSIDEPMMPASRPLGGPMLPPPPVLAAAPLSSGRGDQSNTPLDPSQTLSPVLQIFLLRATLQLRLERRQFNRIPRIDCPVCGDETKGIHYEIYACEACKHFFKRNQNNGFVCHQQNTCVVKKENRKRGCKRCRFIKCLNEGMTYEHLPHRSAEYDSTEVQVNENQADTTVLDLQSTLKEKDKQIQTLRSVVQIQREEIFRLQQELRSQEDS